MREIPANYCENWTSFCWCRLLDEINWNLVEKLMIFKWNFKGPVRKYLKTVKKKSENLETRGREGIKDEEPLKMSTRRKISLWKWPNSLPASKSSLQINNTQQKPQSPLKYSNPIRIKPINSANFQRQKQNPATNPFILD